MKLYVGLYRTIDFPSPWLTCNLEPKDALSMSLEERLRKRFGPLAPRIKFFTAGEKATAGIEVLNFDLQDAETLQAGLVQCDPIDSVEISMVDGALRSELERLGVPLPDPDFQWRMFYETRGN